MKTKDFILKQVKKKGRIKSSEIAQALGITRQSASQHLRELVAKRKLLKVGSTINTYYSPYRARTSKRQKIEVTRRTKGLQEDILFDALSEELNLPKTLSKAGYDIIAYALTEMVNNAIDHSRSPKLSVQIENRPDLFSFLVKDTGIGAFESIRKKFQLNDHYEAVEHLLKGKQTTDPKRHSGQGIFFTSKIADRFLLSSAKLSLIVDNQIQDVFLEDLKRPRKGTEVRFEIAPRTSKSLKALFDEYSNEDYEFDRSKIVVHLSTKKGPYVSRSEAKRLLFGLDKYRRLLLDFKGVDMIGQGFADEIFRVFTKSHPNTSIEITNATKAVIFMIKRARSQE